MVKILRIVQKQTDIQETQIENLFSEARIQKLSEENRYDKCGIKKITASALVHGFLQMFQEGKNSTRILALKIGLLTQTVLRKESLEARFNRRTLNFVLALLKLVMECRVNIMRSDKSRPQLSTSILEKFKNVYISDSTCQAAPENLIELFPSSHNKAGKSKATLRLQVIYNYTAQIFAFFDICSFRDNDQSASDNIFEVAQAGDLVIRDLGYFVLPVFAKMIEKDINFISKYKHGVKVLDAENEQVIDLLKLFKGKKRVDMEVKLGSKDKVGLRLVANKLPKLVAAQRIAKAKAQRHSKTKHSKEYYELLKWEIYITNVDNEILLAKDFNEIYKIRWFIEIIFKTWKSYFNFKKILNTRGMSYYRTLITIVLMLVKITYAFTHLFSYIDEKVQDQYHKIISPLKFMDLINSLWYEIINVKNFKDLDFLLPQFAAHATYEVRNNRKNMRNSFI